jgi:hypothetical protein
VKDWSQTEINITSMKVYNGQEDKEERQNELQVSCFSYGLKTIQMEILTNLILGI